MTHRRPPRPRAQPAPTRRTPGRCGAPAAHPRVRRDRPAGRRLPLRDRPTSTIFDSPLTLYFLLPRHGADPAIALPMTLIIITGEIDLSVASVVGLSSVLVGMLHHDAGLSIPAAAAARDPRRRLPARSTASWSRTSGCRRWPSRSARSRSSAASRSGCSAPRRSPTSRRSGPTSPTSGSATSRAIPLILVPFVVLLVLFVRAAALHDLRPRRLRDRPATPRPRTSPASTSSAPSSCCSCWPARSSAFAGIYFTLRFGSARGDNATGLELQVIAAVLLGGVSIFGGRGALHGVIAGVLLIGVISSALRLESVAVNVINIIIGLLLVALGDRPRASCAWVSRQLPARRRPPGPRALGPRHAAAQAPRHQERHNHEAHTRSGRRARRPGAGGQPRAHRLRQRRRRRRRTTAATAAAASHDVTFLPKNLGNPYFDTSTPAARRRSRSSAAAIEEVGPDEATPDAQVPYINTAAQQGVGALVVSANDPDAHLRRAQRGARRRRQGRHLRLRHRPRVPRPVRQPGTTPRASPRPRST